MEIRIKDNSVEIEGYVNAIERLSKPLNSRTGRFLERIKKGAFKRALERNKDVRILLNHDWRKDLGGTKEGNLELTEDNIGLRARAIITDKDVVETARQGGLVGWSFGFEDRDVEESSEAGMLTREVKDLDLYEVSLLDRTKTPAYEGTLVNVRSEDGTEKAIYYGEELLADIKLRDDSSTKEEETAPEEEQANNNPSQTQEDNEAVKDIDYSEVEKIIDEMKGDNYQ